MNKFQFTDKVNDFHEFKYDDKNEQTIKILHTGNFEHGYGKFSITAENLSVMKENFDSKIIGTDAPIDFSHNNSDKAAGWIKEVSLSDDGESMYAKIKWTDSGANALDSKEFRYFSATFTLSFKDGSTGKKAGATLLGGALTNIPFLRHNPPIVELSTLEKQKEEKEKEELKKMDKTIELSEHNAKVLELQEKLNVLEGEKKELSLAVEKTKELEAELQGMKADKVKNEKVMSFESLLKDGKACEAQRESFLNNDVVEFAAKAVNLNIDGKGTDKDKDKKEIKLSAEEAKVAKQFNLSDEEFLAGGTI